MVCASPGGCGPCHNRRGAATQRTGTRRQQARKVSREHLRSLRMLEGVLLCVTSMVDCAWRPAQGREGLGDMTTREAWPQAQAQMSESVGGGTHAEQATQGCAIRFFFANSPRLASERVCNSTQTRLAWLPKCGRAGRPLGQMSNPEIAPPCTCALAPRHRPSITMTSPLPIWGSGGHPQPPEAKFDKNINGCPRPLRALPGIHLIFIIP